LPIHKNENKFRQQQERKGADKRLPDIWRAGCKEAGRMMIMMMLQFNALYEISFRFGTNWILLSLSLFQDAAVGEDSQPGGIRRNPYIYI